MKNQKSARLQNVQADLASWKEVPLHHRINTLAYAESPEALYHDALSLLIEFTEADSATCFRLDAENRQLIVQAIIGDQESQHLVGLRLPMQEALTHVENTSAQPIIIGDLPGDPRWLRVVSPAFAARMVNLISLPLRVKDELWGVVQVYNYRVENLNLEQLEILGERIAVEFERKDTIERLQVSNHRLLNLLDAIGDASGLMNRKQILQTMLKNATELVDAERASIFLDETASSGIRFQVAYQTDNAGQDRKHRQRKKERHHRPALSSENNPAHLVSRSAITVPIKLQASRSDPEEDFRSLGGLMALNPFDGSFDAEDVEILSILAQQTGNFLQVAEVFESTEQLFLDAIKALVTAIDAKDPYTQGHSHRVSEYSVLVAQALGLSGSQINDIRIGSLLHDVGKIGIPDDILKKDSALTPGEWMAIKDHPLTGWNILRQVRLLGSILPAIIEHHEKLDGSGYPYGLKGDHISMMGRIVAVVDVFDAMTSDRPYRPALKVAKVLDYLEEKAGTLFDPCCVSALKKVVEKYNEID